MAEVITYFVEHSNVIFNVSIGYFVLLWSALVIWTINDLGRRPVSLKLKLVSVSLVLVGGLFGFIIYLILRPRTTYEDTAQEDLERRFVESQVKYFYCKACEFPVKEDFVLCPNCLKKLKNVCQSCSRLLEVNWLACPFCGRNRLALPTAVSLPAGGLTAAETFPAPVMNSAFAEHIDSRAEAVMAPFPLNQETSIYEHPVITGEAKRGRGRPRKSPVGTTIAKRGRGRPRKESQPVPMTVDSSGN